jgi:histidinol-phosphate aminotransferase
VNLLTQQTAMALLDNYTQVEQWIQILCDSRSRLMEQIAKLSICEQVYPSDANFFLVKVSSACDIYSYLVKQGIIVRNRHNIELCGNCLRITVGTNDENDILMNALKQYTEQV